MRTLVVRHFLNCIEVASAHHSSTAEASGLEMERIFVVEVVRGEGEANDVLARDGDDSSPEAALFIEGKFECSCNPKSIELAAGGVEEWFGFGEFLDYDTARVERGRWFKWARGWHAEANAMAVDVQAASGERENVAIVISGDPQPQARAAHGQHDDPFSPGDSAD